MTSSSTTAAAKVHDGGLGTSSTTEAATASLARVTALVSARPAPAAQASGVPTPLGKGWSRTARAAFAAASEAMCESVAIETPSQTTRTARDPAGSPALSDMASSLRAWRLPMSQTPPTHDVGDSTRWSRGLGGGVPQWSQ